MAKNQNSRGRYQNRNRGPKGLRRNDRIRASEVRVIGPEGTNLGVMSSKKALELAQGVGLDLIEISPGATPPVCRILDFGKYLYEESKKNKDSKQHAIKLKEVKFRVRIDEQQRVVGRAIRGRDREPVRTDRLWIFGHDLGDRDGTGLGHVIGPGQAPISDTRHAHALRGRRAVHLFQPG